jgi:taurine dioxygenase
MRVTPLPGALGALVDQIDLNDPLSGAARDELVAAFLKNHLLLFRGQELTDEQHVELARTFGPIVGEALDGSKTVNFVSNTRPGEIPGSSPAAWHIDFGFFEHPYEAISLYGLEIPANGTETLFVNAVAAARDLPDGLRRRVEHLQARQVIDIASPAGEGGVRVRLGRLDESYPHATRPVLWPHRVTGQEILGVWEQQTDALLPLDPAESTALIEELFEHLYKPEHVYVHHWEPHDFVIWDNHALQHARPEVGVEEPRTLRRVCVGRTLDLAAIFGRPPVLATDHS